MKQKTSKLAIVVSAPSGAGKTTIISRLLRDNSNWLEFAVSTTTRPPRAGEIDGKNYYFVDQAKFQTMIDNNEFLEWAQVHTNYYGTSKKEIDRIHSLGKVPIFDVDVQGAYSFKNKLEDAIYIFILPPSLESLKARLTGRGTDSAEQISIRIKNALTELKAYKDYDYLIVNDEVEKAVDDFYSIIKAEMCRCSRVCLDLNFLEENKCECH